MGRSYLVQYYIVSGRAVEVRQSRISARSDKQFPQRRSPRRAGSSTERKIVRNETEAVKRLARSINANFGRGDIFLTRKYSDATLPESYEASEEEMRRLIEKVRDIYRKKTGENLKYIWNVSERDPRTGEKVRLHGHIVMNSLSYEIMRTLIADQDELNYSVMDGRGDHTALAVYMIGNGKTETANKHKWHSSKGLAKPIYTEPEIISEIREIETPEGVDVREKLTMIDAESGQQSAYCRFVLAAPPRVRGKQVDIPKPPRRRRRI